jgi:hypothetical protein
MRSLLITESEKGQGQLPTVGDAGQTVNYRSPTVIEGFHLLRIRAWARISCYGMGILIRPVTTPAPTYALSPFSGVQAALSLALAMALANLINNGLRDIEATRYSQRACPMFFSEDQFFADQKNESSSGFQCNNHLRP